MGAIVRSDEIFLEMERRDQQQIVAAATGEVIGELMYKVKGKNAISWAGINHICFFMGDIEIDQWVEWDRIVMFEDRVYWSATVRARNTKYNLSSLGTAECPELQKIYDLDDNKEKIPDPQHPGKFKSHLEPDEHCRRKSLSKAQRNAKRAVIPEALLKKWLQYFQDMRTGKEVVPPGQPKVVESTQEPPKKTEKKAPDKDEKSTQAALKQGKVTTSTVDYNLKAANVTEDMVGKAFEEEGFIVVEPVRELVDQEHYLIFGVLEPMGAQWEMKGLIGRWVIEKR